MAHRPDDPHLFETRLRWKGAEAGPAASYAGYSRELEVAVPGKPVMSMSAAPVFRGDGAVHNPEDLLVAALSACHCLSYLALAVRAGLTVTAYEDAAIGTMRRVDGVIRFTDVLLRPRVTIAGGSDANKARALHERAHAECFIASSVNFPVRNEPEVTIAG
jgi:organic hydroperoxide reductase OsmC/OhrA